MCITLAIVWGAANGIEMGGAGLMFFGTYGFINYDIHGDIGYIWIYHISPKIHQIYCLGTYSVVHPRMSYNWFAHPL